MPSTYHVVPADVKKQILDRVKQGDDVKLIAQEHGISHKTIYYWLSKGATAAPTWLELNKLKKQNEALLLMIGELMFEKKGMEKKGIGSSVA